ncbi:hypothetical protein CASFOL_001630 [Castilleja foliolosa]|uniref:Uncharacterized protein n=1 Tax=Castilleja foliolosa TaxID=1961234 RepID=A0ABD3EJQ0_9LAMI
MYGMWSKLIKTLSLKNAGPSASSSQLPPRVSKQSDSRSPSSAASSDSSSFSDRLSRSFSSGGRVSKKACAICLGNVRSRQGQAIFTAECSHSFHFSCIANSVKHGHYLCPICRCKWKEIPFQMPTTPNNNNTANRSITHTPPPLEDSFSFSDPVRYSDDEPLFVGPTGNTSSPTPSDSVSIKAVPEFPALAALDSVSNLAILIGVRAPSLLDDGCRLDRAPIDLVTVLDVSASMAGSKLTLLKRAVHFVVDNLGPADRLSVVSFSTSARRIFPLRRMTHSGREDARLAIDSLSSDGGTNVVEGLKKGARVLEERRENNPIASIILLSDGKDTCNTYRAGPNRAMDYLTSLPASVLIESGPGPNFPVHTFGFGADHDSNVLHAISDASGGTFSFIESVGLVQDAFARCIGGLLSIVAHELRLTMTSLSPAGVEIRLNPSGRYAHEISEDRLRGAITIGELYADEEKEFLIYLSVPVCYMTGKTPLLRIECSYKDISNSMVKLEGERVEIRRPDVQSPEDGVVNLEIDRQKVRLSVVEAIAEAKDLAESGDLAGAQVLLTTANSALLCSASARSGDGLCSQLMAELAEIRRRMANLHMYEREGRAYMLSGLSSHSSQRSTTRSSNSGPVGYDTPSMTTMISHSQNLSAEYYYREQAREQGIRLTRSTSSTGV